MSDLHWMMVALKQAKLAKAHNEVPVGAVLVKNNQLIATGYNQPIGLHDPSAHAEINCLRNAGMALQNYRLIDTTMYITLEPCAMCAGAIIHARIKRLVIAASDPKTGAAGSVFNLTANNALNHQVMVEMGVLAEESRQLLRAFFQERRC